MDPHAILGLHGGATRREIRRAYLRLARQWHPDVNRAHGAHERFVEIRRAYDALTRGASPAAASAPAAEGEGLSSALAREIFERINRPARDPGASFETHGIRVTIQYKR